MFHITDCIFKQNIELDVHRVGSILFPCCIFAACIMVEFTIEGFFPPQKNIDVIKNSISGT